MAMDWTDFDADEQQLYMEAKLFAALYEQEETPTPLDDYESRRWFVFKGTTLLNSAERASITLLLYVSGAKLFSTTKKARQFIGHNDACQCGCSKDSPEDYGVMSLSRVLCKAVEVDPVAGTRHGKTNRVRAGGAVPR